ncbi:MAG: M28 family peptidase [Capsulimonadales bacterium]|nr:M28 family peptidase [Capsulimonadales bacterium]
MRPDERSDERPDEGAIEHGMVDGSSSGRFRFDGDRAFVDLRQQTDFGPRVPGTPGHRQCRDWLLAEWESVCGNCRAQDFLAAPRGRPLPMTNILSVLRPELPSPVLLCAHWDTRPTADREPDPSMRRQPICGANDGASGVAVLLQLARHLALDPPPVGVQFVLFDGEDYGPGRKSMFLGSRHYAAAPVLPRPRFAILLDMVGRQGLRLRREYFSERFAPEVNDRLRASAVALGLPEYIDEIGAAVEDDHLFLQAIGWPAVALIDIDDPHWHTLADTPEHCSPRSLAAVGSLLWHLLHQCA